tara:strand:+ start:448 stop:828 length:381 start_codon:yes stop_codon:yes gene_type:complete
MSNPNIHIIYKVHGGTLRCAALEALLSTQITGGWVTDSIDHAMAYVRDVIGLAQQAVQPETYKSECCEYIGKATVVVMVDDKPHASVTLTPDNKVITFGFKWKGGLKEWERHRTSPYSFRKLNKDQ